jgi:hypothetical protein
MEIWARQPRKGDENWHNAIERERWVDQEMNIKNDVDLRHRDSQAFRRFSGFSARDALSLPS